MPPIVKALTGLWRGIVKIRTPSVMMLRQPRLQPRDSRFRAPIPQRPRRIREWPLGCSPALLLPWPLATSSQAGRGKKRCNLLRIGEERPDNSPCKLWYTPRSSLLYSTHPMATRTRPASRQICVFVRGRCPATGSTSWSLLTALMFSAHATLSSRSPVSPARNNRCHGPSF